jgi:4-oxalocrotonate tautomerase
MPVVRVAWFEGKTAQQKKAVAADVTDSIARHTGTAAEYVYVIFEDVSPADWAAAGKLYRDDSAASAA